MISRYMFGIKPDSYVISSLKKNELSLQRGLDVEELLNWLRESRKPVAELVSKISLEDEMLEDFS